MKKSKFTEEQIVRMRISAHRDRPFRQAETCRKHGISEPTYYVWKSVSHWTDRPTGACARPAPLLNNMNPPAQRHTAADPPRVGQPVFSVHP